MYKDLKYIIGGSAILILFLVCVMFFSPLSSQFTDAYDGALRGSLCEADVNELLDSNQYEQALYLVDSLIEAKSKDIPDIAYFDRFLPEDERYKVINARVDIYELQWLRIEILKSINDLQSLHDALEKYVRVIGYNQDSAAIMLQTIKTQ